MLNAFSQEQTNALLLLVFSGNMLTGLIGWIFASWKGWNL